MSHFLSTKDAPVLQGSRHFCLFIILTAAFALLLLPACHPNSNLTPDAGPGPDAMDGFDASDSDQDPDGDSIDGSDDEPTCALGQPDCCGNEVCDPGEEECGCAEDCDDCYEILWELGFGESIAGLTSDGQGGLIVRSSSKVTRITTAGEILWQKEIGGPTSGGRPSFDKDSQRIMFCGTDDNLYWLDLDGNVVSKVEFVTPASRPDNGWLSLATNGSLIALNPMQTVGELKHLVVGLDNQSKEILWTVEEPHDAFSNGHPTIDLAGNIWITAEKRIGDWGNFTYLFKYSPTGELLKERGDEIALEPGNEPCCLGSPVLGSGGTILYTNGNYELVCVDADAEELWRFAGVGDTKIEPIVDADGNIYFADGSATMTKLDPAGQVLWSKFVGFVGEDGITQPVYTTPVLTTHGELIVPLFSRKIQILNAADGEIINTISTQLAIGNVRPISLIDDSGLMVVHSLRYVFGLKTNLGALAEGCWPMEHGNRYTTNSSLGCGQ